MFADDVFVFLHTDWLKLSRASNVVCSTWRHVGEPRRHVGEPLKSCLWVRTKRLRRDRWNHNQLTQLLINIGNLLFPRMLHVLKTFYCKNTKTKPNVAEQLSDSWSFECCNQQKPKLKRNLVWFHTAGHELAPTTGARHVHTCASTDSWVWLDYRWRVCDIIMLSAWWLFICFFFFCWSTSRPVIDPKMSTDVPQKHCSERVFSVVPPWKISHLLFCFWPNWKSEGPNERMEA